ILLLFVFQGISQTKGNVKGTVKEKNGNPIPSAAVPVEVPFRRMVAKGIGLPFFSFTVPLTLPLVWLMP
ncbi:MAG: hypothetical protein AAF934_06405, partial [Bacteroidota bacterium]